MRIEICSWPGKLFMLGLIATLHLGCQEEELDVSYLYVPKFDFQYEGQDEASAITDVRVVIGAKSLGFYPLPAKIPILGTGSQSVRLEPVILRSGVSDQRRVYPFYSVFESQLNLQLGRVDTIIPSIRYADSVVVAFDEGFEENGSQFVVDLVLPSSANLGTTTTQVRDGRSSAVVTLNSAKPIFELASTLIVPRRESIGELWLELDYWGDVPIFVGLLPESPSALPDGVPRSARYFQGALPRVNWQKFYFNIVDESNETFVKDGFRVVILAEANAALGAEQMVYLDNIRVVYR